MKKHVVFNKASLWDLDNYKLDFAKIERHWKGTTFHKTDMGTIALYKTGEEWCYSTFVNKFDITVPWWIQIEPSIWSSQIEPHIIHPSSFSKEAFDEDDIELAKIFMEEIDEKT